MMIMSNGKIKSKRVGGDESLHMVWLKMKIDKTITFILKYPSKDLLQIFPITLIPRKLIFTVGFMKTL